MSSLRSRPVLVDSILAVVLFGLALALNDVGYESGPLYPWAVLPRYAVSVAVLAVAIGPVALRRRFPLSALVTGTAGLFLARRLHVPEYQITSIALFLLLYSGGRWGAEPWRNRLRLVSVLLVLLALAFGVNEERQLLELDVLTLRSYILASFVGILGNLVYVVAPWILADVVRSRAQRESDLAQANHALVRSRADAERRAVTDERLRIARELHDVVAHHVSVMGVQAGAARRVVEASPSTAVDALSDIEESSRQAVTELHRLLGFLRQDDAGPESRAADGAVADPAPSLAQLPSLQRQTAAAGLAVSLNIVGERPASLPASVDLSAYRIVQEGLTNALKHSGEQEAEVEVVYGTSEVRVSVRDRGSGVSRPAVPGTGNGLVGMQERVALHGGHLRFGPGPDGGFVVEATLPFDRVANQVPA